MSGAATNPNTDVIVKAETQDYNHDESTAQRLGGENYAFMGWTWRGKKPFLLNTDLKREREQIDRFTNDGRT